ncbi:tripartite tricarboxylate transporter substrate binding protein [Rhodoplanes sp. TEM]|uniref:Tripartite tricarboxylate transporter substrate binding protein n=1 Tax=Rhodoplanes tepidamans TaxID=200616 RepID=A0ABT5JCB3_RHOTP|nr:MULTISPECIES: tripartite tricarboxylate transporter substrate binding protein [Rhodoplanes]MDC7787256.1 tripartite tricarboxylate transporter substrate binding protein [Rhodoplanes tepidamans]MDC7985284.1 tripartite tricarboxylate transporter substrate binding protein [Rhodoplanes sp. TEM]MDQ0357791.1 tripartite-type tricarboxylate transporter receptor subunit TctC [Rhodoplanes tepidamans]
MTKRPRHCLAAVVAAAVLACVAAPTPAAAQEYPTQVIRLVVPTPPGGMADLLGRIIAQKISENTKATMVVENKTGAAGLIAAELVAKAPPDGYTLFLGYHSTQSILPLITARMPYDPVKDFTPVIYLAIAPNVLVVNPAVPAGSVQELVAWVKANPGKASYASQGKGTTGHLGGEMLAQATGIRMTHVPYRGGAPALQDVIGGQVTMMFDIVPLAREHVTSGRVKALAVTAPQRVAPLPDVPTTAEAGIPDVQGGAWWGLFAPAGTRREVVDWLNAETRRAFDGDVRARLTEQGLRFALGTPEELAEHVRRETERWRAVIEKAGIKPE